MYVGVQGIGTSTHELQFLVRHGVNNMDTNIDPDDVDQIVRQREEAAAEGVSLEMTHIPFPRSIEFAQERPIHPSPNRPPPGPMGEVPPCSSPHRGHVG